MSAQSGFPFLFYKMCIRDRLGTGINIRHIIIRKTLTISLRILIIIFFNTIACHCFQVMIPETFVIIDQQICLLYTSGSISGRNPFRLLKNMLPAYATALGTQSSAATIPVTLAQTVKNGVRETIAIFVVPLCATIHLSGSTMKITACAMAIMYMLSLIHI